MNKEKEKLNNNHKYIINDDIIKLIAKLVGFIIVSCVFGYLGYTFAVDNNYNVQKGIVYGALFPFGAYFINDKIINNFEFGTFATVLIYVLYIEFTISVLEYAPIYIGIIIIFLLFFLGIILIVEAFQENMTSENKVENKKENTIIKTEPVALNNIKSFETDNSESFESEIEEYDLIINDEEPEYSCERCGEPISEEEYEDNAGLCEDCSAEVYFGERHDYDDFDMYK